MTRALQVNQLLVDPVADPVAVPIPHQAMDRGRRVPSITSFVYVVVVVAFVVVFFGSLSLIVPIWLVLLAMLLIMFPSGLVGPASFKQLTRIGTFHDNLPICVIGAPRPLLVPHSLEGSPLILVVPPLEVESAPGELVGSPWTLLLAVGHKKQCDQVDPNTFLLTTSTLYSRSEAILQMILV